MNWTAKGVMALAVLLSVANGAELKPETIHEWEDYLARADAHDGPHAGNFLRVDESEQRLQHVRAGQIVVAPIQPKMPIAVRHGLVHHWRRYGECSSSCGIEPDRCGQSMGAGRWTQGVAGTGVPCFPIPGSTRSRGTAPRSQVARTVTASRKLTVGVTGHYCIRIHERI